MPPTEAPLAPWIRVQGTWWRITRPSAGPFVWTAEPADGRWQRGEVVRAIYLGDTEATVWAEWFRHTSEAGVPPARRLPRDIWRVEVDIEDIVDLTAPGVLAGQGVDRLEPSHRQWPITQPIGEAHFRAGARGVLAPSAARRGGRVLAVFRRGRGHPGLVAIPPAERHEALPPLPRGLRT